MGLLSTIGGIVGNMIAPGIGGAIGAGLGGAFEEKKAIGQAAEAQTGASQAGIDEMRRQFDLMRQGLQPYTQAGTEAIGGYQPFIRGGLDAYQQQLALSGVSGPEAQRQAIAQLEQGPQFQALARQGEEAMLQRASATGGLRGGNIQAALAQFRPQMLSDLIKGKMTELGGLASGGFTGIRDIAQLGQASAAGVGTQGMRTAQDIAGLIGQQGAARAGQILGQQSALTGGVTGAFGSMAGAGFNPASFFSTLPTAMTYGTFPGSQQSQMLAAQEQGF